MNGSRTLMSRSLARMKNSHGSMNRFPGCREEAREQASSAVARQAGAARLDRPAVDSGHLYRCFRFAVLWRDGQADDLPVGTATGCARRCRRKHRSLPTSRARLLFRWLRRTQQFRNCHLRLRPRRKSGIRADPAEQTQLLQTMARDLASVQQEIEQLKASQAELARENARTAEQLKANQEQMARAIASASEQNLRPRTSATSQRHRRRHQLIRHGRLPRLRVSPCRRFRRRKPERKRGRQCSCSPDNSSFHRRRRPPKAVSPLSLVAIFSSARNMAVANAIHELARLREFR